ncbi:Hsp20/alpha crystallin family protein [bacterium]|nr:Hsp20/alpha crystallin family protein [bacterium]
MNLIRTNTLAPRRVDLFSEVSRELDHMFNEVFAGPYFAGKKSKGYPLMDAIQGDGTLTLQYTVPGVKLEDLDVEVTRDDQGRILTVSGKLSEEYTHQEDTYAIRELSSREFRRVIRLPEDVTEDEPEATLKDGVLKLEFKTTSQKQELLQTKKLKIKSE